MSGPVLLLVAVMLVRLMADRSCAELHVTHDCNDMGGSFSVRTETVAASL